MASLAARVDETLAQLDIPKEEHAFNPHLTLARGAEAQLAAQAKNDHPNRSFELQEKLAALPAPEFGTMTAREFFLYRSQAFAERIKVHEAGGIPFAIAHPAGD